MGTSVRRTERVLADAASKIAAAEDALRTYGQQRALAAEQKRQLEDENERLRGSILSLALQHANGELRREHVQLRQTLDSYQTKIDQMREISLLSAKVVDSRIKTKQGRQYVEYKLQIETDIRGTLVLWHRYSTFLWHEIPELQTQSLTGFFSDQLIIDRIAKLNEFLEVVTKAEEFQWGIRMDKDTVVYKRKTKRASGERSYSAESRESISTLTMSSRDSMFMSPVRPSTIAMADSL
ncbi:hypothetical protein PybrP1_011990 [[Pythium] brassicae (nom. inval.)]|nr:hypothetical protein PybrP1_011990 [[Pythium] brassicae (nom. inval.)]